MSLKIEKWILQIAVAVLVMSAIPALSVNTSSATTNPPVEVPTQYPTGAAASAASSTDLVLLSPHSSNSGLSCTSAGNCVSVGQYQVSSTRVTAEIDVESSGIWSVAFIPDFSQVSPQIGNWSILDSVSCWSEGNCMAVGYYVALSGQQVGVSVMETNGTWSQAVQHPWVNLAKVSCAADGTCGVNGLFATSLSIYQNGTWTKTEIYQATNLAYRLSAGDSYPISCSIGANCSAVMYSNTTPILVSSVHGTWSLQAPFNSTFVGSNPGYNTQNAVSCSSPGNCTIAGRWNAEAVFSTMSNYVLAPSSPITLPSDAIPQTGSSGDAISCSAPGDCGIFGSYLDVNYNSNAFVIEEVGGVWQHTVGDLVDVGTDIYNQGGVDFSISCPSAGNCVGAGLTDNGYNAYQPFTVSEVNGSWGAPQLLALSTDSMQPSNPFVHTFDFSGSQYSLGLGNVSQISCSSNGNCDMVGYYLTNGQVTSGFSARIGSPVPQTLLPSVLGISQYVTLNSSIVVTNTSPQSLTGVLSGVQYTVTYPVNALPTGTIINTYSYVNTAVTSPLAIDSYPTVSIVVAWMAPDGTTPTAVSPLTLKFASSSIGAGTTAHSIQSGVSSLPTATLTLGSLSLPISTSQTVILSLDPPHLPPEPVTGVLVTMNTGGSAQVTWPLNQSIMIPVLSYTVNANGQPVCNVALGNGCTSNGYAPNTPYLFSVTATNQFGSTTSAMTAPISWVSTTTTTPNSGPVVVAPPAVSFGAVSAHTVQLIQKSTVATSTTVLKYSLNGGPWTSAKVSSTSLARTTWTISGLVSKKSYRVQVVFVQAGHTSVSKLVGTVVTH